MYDYTDEELAVREEMLNWMSPDDFDERLNKAYELRQKGDTRSIRDIIQEQKDDEEATWSGML